MKCPKCDGTGKMEIGVGAFTIHGADCDQCNGKGVIEPMTNEEWLHSLNTEQLAEWMVMLQLVGVHPIKRGSVDTEMFIADTVEWLKQPHKDGES